MANSYHVPALFNEVIEGLALKVGGTYVDATVGGGGHSRGIAERIGSDGVVIGIDRDSEALTEATKTLAGAPAKFIAVRATFDTIADVLSGLGYSKVDGVLYDLGVSSKQLDDVDRGFSFRDIDAALDMRMSQDEDTATASDLLNESTAEELTSIFRDYADERWASRIAQFVVERRNGAPFKTAGDLIDTVKAAIPAAARSKDIHPATKTFQALRIAVNDEYGRLHRSLDVVIDFLHVDGRLLTISWHSGEDRICKQTFAEWSGKCICPPELPTCVCGAMTPKVELITKKPIVPTGREIAENPRSRSAKLRIVRRIG